VGKRGEVWQVDFGMVQKIRPAVVVSVPCQDSDRSLTAVVPHTTAIHGSRFEVAFPVRFLESGAFLVRRLGVLSTEQLAVVEAGLRQWLGAGIILLLATAGALTR
jgi:mRNA interferase MazF